MSNEIRFSADPATRYAECAMIHPEAGVRFRQIAPVENDDVPGLLVKDAPKYDDLIRHLKVHGDSGRDAVYKWTVWDTRQPQWAAGTITIAASETILQFFAYDHLPEHLQEVSKLFHDVAHEIAATLPRNAERAKALDRLLEAKDAAVRARLAK